MTDKEKIKEEVERLLNKEWRLADSTEGKYRRETYRELLEYIDSLPEEPVSEDLEEAAKRYAKTKHTDKSLIDIVSWDFIEGANWQKEQFEKNRLAACDRQTKEAADIEMDFVMGILKEHRQPTFDDAIKYGKKKMIDKACSYLNYHLNDRVEVRVDSSLIPQLITKIEFIERFRKAMEDEK